MKLKKFALLAEIASGAAILVTLAVLVVEVRTNGALLQRQIELERIAMSSQPIESPYLADILEKINAIRGRRGRRTNTVPAFVDQYGLSQVEAQRYVRWLRGQWQMHQADFRSGLNSRLDRDIQDELYFSDMQLFWQESKAIFDDDFVLFVDGLNSQQEVVGD